MYIDGVILFSLATIALILWMMGYIGLYAYRHIKKDIAEHKKLSALQKSHSSLG